MDAGEPTTEAPVEKMEIEKGMALISDAQQHTRDGDFDAAQEVYNKVLLGLASQYGEDAPELGPAYLAYGKAQLWEYQAMTSDALVNEAALGPVEGAEEKGDEDELDLDKAENLILVAYGVLNQAKKLLRDNAQYVQCCAALGEVLMSMNNPEESAREYGEAAERSDPKSTQAAKAYMCQAVSFRYCDAEATKASAAKALVILMENEEENKEDIEELRLLVEDCEEDFETVKKVAKELTVGTHAVAVESGKRKAEDDDNVQKLKPKKKSKITPVHIAPKPAQ
eukprot:TRINITY_DN5906_c0_g1_i1.p3 TRINITY_DN5906_c0_g1~~TRINITY_DN5906_c0_g1_i1.p3  ORF type:complete len:282 (+),score=150.02 TRINITY_DN5906_c0_g1_i1:55-900(+)